MKRFVVVWLCISLIFSASSFVIDKKNVTGSSIIYETKANQVHNVDTDEYFSTIQLAINDSDTLNGHSIEVNASSYNENVLVNKQLTIIGEDTNSTFLDGGFFRIISDWVNLSGFSIFNSSNAIIIESSHNVIHTNNISFGISGITLDSDANYNTIRANSFYKNREHCIIVNSGNNTISNNYLCDNGGNIGDGSYYPCIDLGQAYYNNISFNVIYTEVIDGIALYYSAWNKIHGNYIYHTNDTYGFRGISLARYSDHNTISHNTICNSPDYGIFLWLDATNVNITENTLINCNYGILYSQYHQNPTEYINIKKNKIYNSRNTGIFLGYFTYPISYANISGNYIVESPKGIYMTGVRDSVFEQNKIENCDYGVYIESFARSENIEFRRNLISNCTNYGIINEGNSSYNAHNCIFYHNSFVNNSGQAYDNGSNIWHNGYPSGGNYWSDYSGMDYKSGPNQTQPGSDGIGDTPYIHIDGTTNRNDEYPLMKPLPIYTEPIVNLTTPNGGEVWHVDSYQNITWTMNSAWNPPSALEVTLDYSIDGGVTFPYNIIANQTGFGPNASYYWQIPNTPTKRAIVRLRVRDNTNTIITDYSDNIFIIEGINPSINLTSPNGGESIMGGGTWEITWTASPGSLPLKPNPITIEYSSTGPVGPWVLISTDEENDGSFEWTPVPFLDTTDCYVRIRVEDIGGFTNEDISNSSFLIDSTKPLPAFNAHAELVATHVCIYWNASTSSDVDHYEIYYSQNNWDPTGDSYSLLAVTGLSTSFQHNSIGIINPNTYFYQVRTFDTAGNEVRTILQAAKLGSTQSYLASPSRWFMLGSFLVQSDTSLAHVIQGLGLPANMDYIQLYDSLDTEDPWKSYSPDRPPGANDLTDILYTQGFWIHLKSSTRFTTAGFVPNLALPLVTGWNLVPYPFAQRTMTTGEIESHLTVNCPNYDSMMIADYGAPYRLKVPTGTENLMHGGALWVKVTADTSWMVMNY